MRKDQGREIQTNDDQRSIGSLGYMGGNIGYIGGGTMGIEYPYEGNATHYQLWKPPSGYFPRSEAPPPYDEAIGQPNTCTVSVATTTHRTLPMSICTTEAPNDGSSGITTNTTNLINININNAGNITTVAAGESHSHPTGYGSSSSVCGNQPRGTQTPVLPIEAALSVSHPSTMQSCSHAIASAAATATSSNSEIVSIAASHSHNLKAVYSTSNTLPSVTCLRSPCPMNSNNMSSRRNHTPKDHHTPKNTVPTPEQTLRMMPTGATGGPSFESNPSAVVQSSCGTRSGHQQNLLKTPSSSRRYHRTIPRHFTAVDSAKGQETVQYAQSSSAIHKKPTCQCPVQHVPMTYMGSSHLSASQNTHNMFVPAISQNRNARSAAVAVTVAPSTAVTKSGGFQSPSPLSTMSSSSRGSGKGSDHYETSLNGENSRPHSANNTLRKMKLISSKLDLGATTATPSAAAYCGGHAKIPTISKQVVTAENINRKTTLAESGNTSSSHQIHSILKTTNRATSLPKNASSGAMVAPPFPLPLTKTAPTELPAQEANPTLPPKMYKSNSAAVMGFANKTSNHMPTQKIHTISNGAEFAMQHHTAVGNRFAHGHYTKSLTRVADDAKLVAATHQTYAYAAANTHSHSHSHSHSLIKSTSASTTAATTLTNSCVSNSSSSSSSSYSMSANHITYSLPKMTGSLNSKTGTATRTSLADVVNMVPSIVSIPAIIKCVDEKPLPVCTTSKNCLNPKEHFLPNDTSLDDDYLSECENCKSAHGSRYYLEKELIDSPQETMTLQRKMPENEDEQTYYRTSCTLPTNTKQKTSTIKNSRETWFTSIPASSSSDEEQAE